LRRGPDALGGSRPDHRPDDGVVRRSTPLEGADETPVAQHGDAIAQPEDFRQPVRDEDDRHARAP
jgi:hypothetical protein